MAGDLHRIEGFTRRGQVATGLSVIDGSKASLAETGRILNDFIAFTVALIILIHAGVQRFINGIGTANLDNRAITDRRLRRRDGCLLLTIITCTGGK